MILYNKSERIATITLNRPEKRNALNAEMVTQIKHALLQAKNDKEVKLILIKANGESFCAGADLAYLQQLQANSYEENIADSTHLMEMFEMIYNMPKVVISIVEGAALAGGCGLASVCDFCIATDESTFGYTEVKIGFIPAIVKVFLLRKLGETKTKELLLTGNIISAEEAAKIGLINTSLPKAELENYIQKLTYKLLNNSSEQSMGLIKEMISNIPSMSVKEALEYAVKMNANARASDDCKKGISAFLNKEKISW